MIVDPVESIADAQVTFLNGSKAGWHVDHRPTITFQAIKHADPNELLKTEKLTSTLVVIVPFGESAKKIDRGGKALETYQTYLMIVRQLDSAFTRPKLGELARQLKLALRAQNRMAGYPWMGDETTAKYELEVLSQVEHFANVTRFDYAGTA
jgi:hypothetical protein